MKKKLLLMLSVSFFFTLTSAQQKFYPLNGNIEVDSHTKIIGTETSEEIFFLAQLHGRITNQNNEAIPGASVMVMELGSGTTTTTAGYYGFQLPPGTYKIQYNFIGCQTVETRAALINDTTYKLDVQLNCELSGAQPANIKFKTLKNKISTVKPMMSAPLKSMEGNYIEMRYPNTSTFSESEWEQIKEFSKGRHKIPILLRENIQLGKFDFGNLPVDIKMQED